MSSTKDASMVSQTNTNSSQPPPLPPRQPQEPPPKYSLEDEGDGQNLNVSDQWQSTDPRSSSTQSLIPTEERNGRRTLLLIYIHGFMGNETSFRGFPAHIHNLLSVTLAETHTVHTKIYPRYKSRKAIEFARDAFSNWLEPNSSASTDIILVGHSLGGILASEVVLLQNHRILGTINLDTPFLGIHPGLIGSGIASLFRAAPESPATALPADSVGNGLLTSASGAPGSSLSSLRPAHSEDTAETSLPSLASSISPISRLPSHDPNYNPPFPNDVRIVERKGWRNLFHFVNKHAEGLTSATKEYFISHLEFGGCLADYPGLKARYAKIRHLEDVDEINSRQDQRVRFINYYTASTGRPKKPKDLEPKGSEEQNFPLEVSMNDMNLGNEETHTASSGILKPEANDVNEGDIVPQVLKSNSSFSDNDDLPLPQMQIVESIPLEDDDGYGAHYQEGAVVPDSDAPPAEILESLPAISEVGLPPLPPVPEEPKLGDLATYTDKDARKIVENEQKRLMKAYQQALKDRDNAVKDRQKLIAKREKKARQAQEDQRKLIEKDRQKREKEEQRGLDEKNNAKAPSKAKPEKPKRDKKFCLLPSDLNGKLDVCWIRVYMQDVDEVGAHCGIFSPDQHYEGFVAEVGNRIEEWVKEDATRRAIPDIEGRHS